MKHQLKIRNNGKKSIIQSSHGENLLKLLHKHGYELNTYCGGQGICGKCKVKIVNGAGEPGIEEKKHLTEKEIKEGIRLACLKIIKEDMELELEQDKEIEVLTTGIITEGEINLDLKKEVVILDKPSLDDQRDFTRRINELTMTSEVNLESLHKLDSIDRKKPFTVTSRGKRIIQIEEGSRVDRFYGLAVDIGTTTIAIYLLNLNTGEEIDVYSFYNPQKKFGADVISRINYTLKKDNGKIEMRDVLVRGLNMGIKELINLNGIDKNDILKVTFVGNTIMLHFLLGLDTESIAKSPYIPIFTNSLELQSRDLGLHINNNGFIQLLPSISSYVGADIVADMVAVKFNLLSERYNLLIDIGTNGEIVLGNGREIYACSAAAGPAFEGANITYGMAGIAGAISEYKIDKSLEKVFYKTIRDEEPVGICGSGLLDIVAELYKRGFIESSGAFKPEKDMETWQRDLMTNYKNQRAFRVLSNSEEGILLTQKDIREVQLAKGAIAAGIEILRKKAGINYKDIERVYIAGGFGNYIDPHNACVIEMIPIELEEKIVQIGNGAGTGAKLYLLNKNLKKEAELLKEKVKYIELSINQDFQMEYINSMNFG